MSINQLVVLLVCLAPTGMMGQNYSFSPGSDYYGELALEMYSEHYVYVAHEETDPAFISWRLMANTCPTDWDIQMCDWQHCYIGLPNTGDMNPVEPGASGNLRLLVNPFLTQGSGMVHFWVYPTGFIEEHQDVFYYLNTLPTSAESESKIPFQIFYASGFLTINSGSQDNYRIYDASGREVSSFKTLETTHTQDLHFLATGLFYCRGDNGVVFRFLKPF